MFKKILFFIAVFGICLVTGSEVHVTSNEESLREMQEQFVQEGVVPDLVESFPVPRPLEGLVTLAQFNSLTPQIREQILDPSQTYRPFGIAELIKQGISFDTIIGLENELRIQILNRSIGFPKLIRAGVSFGTIIELEPVLRAEIIDYSG